MGFWTHRPSDGDADEFAGQPTTDTPTAWLVGLGFAAVPVSYGVWCLCAGRAVFFGDVTTLDLVGATAVAYAVASIALGAFIHFHWFWGMQSRLARWSYPAKMVAAIVFLAGFGFAVWRILVDHVFRG
jgi:hypothetical protein